MKEWLAQILDNGCHKYSSHIISSEEAKSDAYQLRYKVFVDKLGWVQRTKEKLEYAYYDSRAVHYCVCNEDNALVGYIRALYERPYMLEREFCCNIPIDEPSFEVSRLAVEPSHIQADRLIVTMMLYRIVYRDMMERNIDWWYMATTMQLYEKLKLIFPVEHLSSIGNGMQGEIIRLNANVATHNVGALRKFFIDMPLR